MRIKVALALIALFFLLLPAQGRKAKSVPATLTQPDGSTFTAVLKGDEFSHIMTTATGEAIVQDGDGWWCYARFDADGGRSSSGERVRTGVTTSTAAASRNIPYEKIWAHAGERRQNAYAYTPEDNPMRRLNRLKYGSEILSSGLVTKGNAATRHVLVILCAFKDVAFRYTRQNFVDMLTKDGYSFNGATGSAKEYFDAQFNGMYDFEFTVSDIVTVSKNRREYGANDSNGEDRNPEEMVSEACRLAHERGIDFSKFDDDNDGEVDNVFIFFAGGDEAEYAGDDCIWSHAYYLYGKSITLDGKTINRYACTAELMTTAIRETDSDYIATGFTMAPIGTFCHEYTHTLGLPDFYDTDYELSGGISDALWGSTSLMDSGNSNNNGNTPPSYNCIEREFLGLAQAQPLREGKLTLSPVAQGGGFHKVSSSNPDEYYLLECRSASGWDKYIGGSGLLVYHIDKSSRSAGRSDSYSRTLTAKQRWETYNEVNCRPDYQCADLIEANPSARSAAQVFFPYGSSTSIGGDTSRNTFSFRDGTDAALNVTNIIYSNGQVTMSVSGSGSAATPPDASIIKVDKFQDAAVVSFESSFEFIGTASAVYRENNGPHLEAEVRDCGNCRYAAVLEGLKPNTNYTVSVVFALEGGVEGNSDSKSFLTSSVTENAYPYIYLKNVERNDDGSFPSGVKLPLRVYNAVGADGIVWRFNAEEVSIGDDGYFTPKTSGRLTAEIIYDDGSRDYLSKQINIK